MRSGGWKPRSNVLLTVFATGALAVPVGVSGVAQGRAPQAVVELGADQDRPGTSDVESGWGFGIIAAYDQFRDDLLVPLRWSGPAVGLHVGWGRRDERSEGSVSIVLPASILENRFGDPAYALGLEASYRYERSLDARAGSGTLWVGGALKWDLHDGFYESWDDEHIYWLNAYSLRPGLRWRRTLGEDTRFSSRLDVAAVALVARPPENRLTKTDPLTSPGFHLAEPHKRLQLVSVPDYTSVQLDLALARRWGGSWLVVAYVVERSSYDAPARVTGVSHRIEVSRHAVR